MSDPFARVTAGQVSPFVSSERTVNAALDRLRKIGSAEQPVPAGSDASAVAITPRCTVFVRNDTGSSLPEFAVLKLGDPLVSASDEPYQVSKTPAFVGNTPTLADDPFCITLQPSKPGQIVRAAILGAAVCDVTYTNINHEYAAPGASGAFALESAATGPAKIVWSAGTSGTQRAVVLLQGDMSAGGTVTSVALQHTWPGDGTPGLSISGSPITTSGTFTITLAGDLAALEATNGTNTIYYRSAADTWSAVTIGSGLSFSGGTLSSTGGGSGTVTSVGITAPAAGITVSGSPITTSGNMTLALSNDLAALEALSGTNTIYYRSAADTWSAVTIGSGLSFSGGTLSSTGGSGTVTSVGITAPAAGITVSGSPVTTSGNMTLALSNDLAALEAYNSVGFWPYRSASDTWTSVTFGNYITFGSGVLEANTPSTPGGRITLTSGTPVTSTDVTGATVIYYTPYLHNSIQLWDGSFWKTIPFSEVSNTPSSPTGNLPRDVFGYLSGGALAIETLAWTNDTTRATAIVYTDGRYTKSGDKTRLYLGTVRTNSGGQFVDSRLQRFVWNMYNRVSRAVLRQDTTAGWNYTTATVRSTNNSTSNRVEVVCGVAGESTVHLNYHQASTNGATNVQRRNGIGEDSTTTFHADCVVAIVSNTDAPTGVSTLAKFVPVGYHYYQQLEWSVATGTTTWFGFSTHQLNGITGTFQA